MKSNQWDRIEKMVESLCLAWGVDIPPRKRVYTMRNKPRHAAKPVVRNGVDVTRRRWTPKETRELARMIKQGHSMKSCAKVLGRTAKACSVQHSRFLRGEA